jgi:hypothetical protein
MNNRTLLVGDNPFHGISHLSQERAIARGKNLSDPAYAATLVRTALDNGADGFMFSVSNTTLSVLKLACAGRKPRSVKLYPIVPYVFEFVRMAVTEGGIPGLAKKLGKEIIVSANIGSIYQGTKGVLANDPASLIRAYLMFEESRIRRAAGPAGDLHAIFLHEVVSDMALSLNMKWLFNAHIGLMQNHGIRPGIHTHNLPSMVRYLKQQDINLPAIALTTQFNALGFGMTPSRQEYEKTLESIPGTEMVAFGILASGYVKLPEALKYINGLPGIGGVVIGVSKEKQAEESFRLAKS